MSDCLWCRVPDSEDIDDPSTLCLDHEAEYEGLSVDQLLHREREQRAEERDMYGD
jgi:hypothetical protein